MQADDYSSHNNPYTKEEASSSTKNLNIEPESHVYTPKSSVARSIINRVKDPDTQMPTSSSEETRCRVMAAENQTTVGGKTVPTIVNSENTFSSLCEENATLTAKDNDISASSSEECENPTFKGQGDHACSLKANISSAVKGKKEEEISSSSNEIATCTFKAEEGTQASSSEEYVTPTSRDKEVIHTYLPEENAIPTAKVEEEIHVSLLKKNAMQIFKENEYGTLTFKDNKDDPVSSSEGNAIPLLTKREGIPSSSREEDATPTVKDDEEIPDVLLRENANPSNRDNKGIPVSPSKENTTKTFKYKEVIPAPLSEENKAPSILDSKQHNLGESLGTDIQRNCKHSIPIQRKLNATNKQSASTRHHVMGPSTESNGSLTQVQGQNSPRDMSDINDALDEEAKRLDKLLPIDEPDLYDKTRSEQEKERQYKNLVDLLSKSKFYTEVLLKKIGGDMGVKKSRKRKAEAAQGDPLKDNSDKDKQCSPSKQKKLEENQQAVYHIAAEVIKNKQSQDDGVMEADDADVDKSEEETQQPKLLCGGILRDYQLEGFKWLRVLYENGVNGILADEMGLGKTIQVIALLCHLIEKKVRGPFLIVAPLSTLPNWVIEFKRFAPQVPVVLYHASKSERQRLRIKLTNKVMVSDNPCYPVVVTSYEVPILDRAFIGRFRWKYIIVDEGHRIKNHNTLLARVLRSFYSANRLLLTGTPLHNSLSELWSLLNFLVPEIFDNLKVFESWFRAEDLSDVAGRQKIIEEERQKNVISTLHQILSPFMLRRVKSEVTLEIPKKKEIVVYAPMSQPQFQLYTAVLNRDFSVLMRSEAETLPDLNGKRSSRSCTKLVKNYKEPDEDDPFPDQNRKRGRRRTTRVSEEEFAKNCQNIVKAKQKEEVIKMNKFFVRVKMQNQLQILRLIANHPYLVHYPLAEDGESFLVDEDVVKSSGKLLVLDAMLSKLYTRGHKVLLFSNFVMVLTIIEDYLTMRQYKYERLDGGVNIENRTESIQRFNSDPDIFLFLISTRAGGLGINLTGADTVIFFDSDWNPQVDLQAQDRCHRIGQTKPVMVYRLVTAGTVDEKILERARAKRALEKVIIHKGAGTSHNRESKNGTLDLEELRSLLESKDHSLVVHTKGRVLSKGELEKLLDRSDLM